MFFLINIISHKSKYGVLIIGLKDGQNVDNINVSDCEFNNVEENYEISGATNVTFDNLKINGKKVAYK